MEQGDSRGAVAAVRALAATGWRVGVGAPGAAGLAASSRRCSVRHDVPAAHRDMNGFIAAVAEAVERVGYEVVFGAGEAEVVALSARRDEIGAVVPYAADEVVQRALDKADLEAAAVRAGIALPPTLALAEVRDPSAPVVVKARRHAAPERRGAPPRIDTNVVFGAAAAHRRVAQIQADGAEPIVQPFLAGDLVAYSAVADRDSQVAADSMQVAARIWPRHAGASCRARTVPVDGDIAAGAQRLFASLGWFGLAELQFIVPADDTPRLIDFNGRFYGSLALAVAAGANLPAVWAALATHRPVARVRARPGVRYQWLEADLRFALSGPADRRLRGVGNALAFALTAQHSLLDVRDPAPGATRLRHIVSLSRREPASGSRM